MLSDLYRLISPSSCLIIVALSRTMSTCRCVRSLVLPMLRSISSISLDTSAALRDSASCSFLSISISRSSCAAWPSRLLCSDSSSRAASSESLSFLISCSFFFSCRCASCRSSVTSSSLRLTAKDTSAFSPSCACRAACCSLSRPSWLTTRALASSRSRRALSVAPFCRPRASFTRFSFDSDCASCAVRLRSVWARLSSICLMSLASFSSLSRLRSSRSPSCRLLCMTSLSDWISCCAPPRAASLARAAVR
mmetsp:Transcript_20443/g.48448  ORF Transcript_20443/g.48448 Transcript_20443/m.48448 type:complete len:251 (-) Transcript_20443:595-1347(-)